MDDIEKVALAIAALQQIKDSVDAAEFEVDGLSIEIASDSINISIQASVKA